MEQPPEVEILVHIGAPSRTVDDVRYRALTSAYIDFEPTRQVHLSSPICSHAGSNDHGHGSDKENSQQQRVQEDACTSSLSSEQIASLQSPQASFRSVIDNAGSPRMVTRNTHETDSAGNVLIPVTQSSWQTPASVVQDSHSGNCMNIAPLSSPTRVLEHYLQQFDSPPGSTQSNTQRSGTRYLHSSPCPATYDYPKQRQELPVTSSTPPIVPCTPRCKPLRESSGSLARETIKNRQEKITRIRQLEQQPQDESTDDNIIEETTSMGSSNPSSAARADSEPLPANRHQQVPGDTSPRSLLRATSDLGPRMSTRQKPLVTITFLSVHGYTYDNLELRAPEPPVSTTQLEPDSFITPGLEKLARDLNIPKRFRPKEQKRDLRPFERGYWALDCSTWDPQLKRDAWAYLANYIGTGVAGWGIWCQRDPEFRWLRAYCWSSVIAHIYLLLYLASQRKILFTETSWVDGEGVAVIVMGVRGHP
ncbi:hypothetical protein F4779DRAFT_468930 [Xylariaceae sp. FL0662B]|nr:hypothetical protein F4779DRAFT_468930 [Xylariaceae sp. FL0662B]